MDFNEYKDAARARLVKGRRYLQAGLGVARSITNFATNKSPLSFIEGGFNVLENLSHIGTTSQQEYFSPERGWHALIQANWKHQPIFDIYKSVLAAYPYQVVNYTNATSRDPDKIHEIPIASIGVCDKCLYFKSKTHTGRQIWDWLLETKKKEINSNFYNLDAKESKQDRYGSTTNFALNADDVHAIDSGRSTHYTQYLQSFLDAGVNRSVIFLGAPGTGKSTLIQTVLKNLDLISFRFRYNAFTTDLSAIKYLLESLKIEALIMDDFEQGISNEFLLQFLEWTNRNIKLVLASSNSLRKINPAIIRPGRFDELFEINEVDDDLLQGLLGNKYEELGERVKKWPVAYINELMLRCRIRNTLNIEMTIKELDERVTNALAQLQG